MKEATLEGNLLKLHPNSKDARTSNAPTGPDFAQASLRILANLIFRILNPKLLRELLQNPASPEVS